MGFEPQIKQILDEARQFLCEDFLTRCPGMSDRPVCLRRPGLRIGTLSRLAYFMARSARSWRRPTSGSGSEGLEKGGSEAKVTADVCFLRCGSQDPVQIQIGSLEGRRVLFVAFSTAFWISQEERKAMKAEVPPRSRRTRTSCNMQLGRSLLI